MILYMLVPSLAFLLLVATCHWRSRSYELNALDTFLAGLSERRKTQEAEDLTNFQLACPTSPSRGDTCIICLEQMRGADLSCKLQCEHEFHPECLFAWWKSQADRSERVGDVQESTRVMRCPTCRQKHKPNEVETLGDEEMIHEVV